MLVLFFDTYIVSGSGNPGGLWENDAISCALGKVRNVIPTYKWQEKIDVVKYALASYSEIAWDKVVIRFECEDPASTESFESYCRGLFPHGLIVNSRSATAKEYLDALSQLDVDDAWVFFSPNNDHPYLAEPNLLREYVDRMNQFVMDYPHEEFGLLYSHFTENILDNYMTSPLWGHFAFNFKSVIYEDAELYVVKTTKASLSSCYVFRLKYLKKIFSSTRNTGRVIRLEDTEFYLSKDFLFCAVIPKLELCRHYDGYYPVIDKVPPLFIPPGFFDSDIKIRYGYENRVDDWVAINPSKDFPDEYVDLPILLEDIPYFWKRRVSRVDRNPNYIPPSDGSRLEFYKNLYNPWNKRPKVINLARALYILIILQALATIRGWIKLLWRNFYYNVEVMQKKFK